VKELASLSHTVGLERENGRSLWLATVASNVEREDAAKNGSTTAKIHG
jgi:hypothetical protein